MTSIEKAEQEIDRLKLELDLLERSTLTKIKYMKNRVNKIKQHLKDNGKEKS